MNGAQWVVHALRAQGVETVFGYPGGAIMPIYDALYDGGVEHLLCRHEQGAAMAAIGYARATGKTGVCMATSGPGATNLITGLADALLDSVPVVAITGQVASPFIGTDAFQEVDVLGLSLACTKHSFLVQSLEELPGVMAEAFRIASSGRPGPVLSRQRLGRRRQHIRFVAIARLRHQRNGCKFILVMLFLPVEQTREDNHPERDQHNGSC